MLNKINKILPYAVIFLMMHMTHSALRPATSIAMESKKATGISDALLHPVFLTPEDHVSPTTRDPFDVTWDSYDPIDQFVKPLLSPDAPDDTNTAPDSASDATTDSPASEPEPEPEPVLPELPTRLNAVITGGDLNLALETVDAHGITLAFGDVRERIPFRADNRGQIIPNSPQPGPSGYATPRPTAQDTTPEMFTFDTWRASPTFRAFVGSQSRVPTSCFAVSKVFSDGPYLTQDPEPTSRSSSESDQKD
jgi:hypothetical protein